MINSDGFGCLHILYPRWVYNRMKVGKNQFGSSEFKRHEFLMTLPDTRVCRIGNVGLCHVKAPCNYDLLEIKDKWILTPSRDKGNLILLPCPRGIKNICIYVLSISRRLELIPNSANLGWTYFKGRNKFIGSRDSKFWRVTFDLL